MDDRSWAGKLRFWALFFWIVLDDDMDWHRHWLQARYGQANTAFELDAMDDKTNLVAVIFRGCSSPISFLLGIPEHHMGPGVFRCLLSTNVDCRCSWDTNSVVRNNILEHLELRLEKDKEMARTSQASAPFPPLFLGVARSLTQGQMCN